MNPDTISTYVAMLKKKELSKGEILHHTVIYCQALDDLIFVLHGNEKGKQLLDETNIIYDKELKQRFWKGFFTATTISFIFFVLMI